MGKLTTFIIVLVVFMMFFAGGIAALMSEMATNYNVGDYNNTKISVFNKLDEISQDTEDIKNKANELQSRSGVLDVLGGFFESAYNTIKVATSSVSLFTEMSDETINNLDVSHSNMLKTGIIVIVFTLIFLGIIVRAVIKTDI